MELNDARDIAERLKRLFVPYCERIEIAGSIRRGKPEVKDIEIVCVPKMLPDESRLFPDSTDLVSYLDRYLENVIHAQHITQDHLRAPAWGPRYKRLRYMGAAVDLFIVRPPAQWGLIYCIRTGPSEFSRAMVMQRFKGGLLPNHLRVVDGHVEHEGKVIDTPHESDVFRLLEIPFIVPEERK